MQAFNTQDFNFELFFDLHLDLLCISNADGNYLAVNNAFEMILGYSTEDLYMKNVLELVHPDDIQPTIDAVSNLQEGQRVLSFTNRVLHRNGSYRHIEWRSHPVGDKTYSAARDVTLIKENENELRKNQLRLQALVETQTNFILRLSLDYKYTYVNDKYLNHIKKFFNVENIIGLEFFSAATPRQNDLIKECFEKCLEEIGVPHQIETTRETPDGQLEYFLWECTCLADSSNKASEIQCIGMDITQKKMQDAKRHEQKELELWEMSTPISELWDGILLLPLMGSITAQRAQNMMQTVLHKIADTQSKVLILDISGVEVVDTAVANHFIKLAKATKLMGCLCTMSGVSPAVAQTIIELGIQIDEIKTTGSMKDALEKGLRETGLELVSIKV